MWLDYVNTMDIAYVHNILRCQLYYNLSKYNASFVCIFLGMCRTTVTALHVITAK